MIPTVKIRIEERDQKGKTAQVFETVLKVTKGFPKKELRVWLAEVLPFSMFE